MGIKKNLAQMFVLLVPPTLIPVDIEKMGVRVSYNIDEEIKDADDCKCA